MADDKSTDTSVTEDTSVAEDTSTNEEDLDTEAVDLEDDDTSFDDFDDDDTEGTEEEAESEESAAEDEDNSEEESDVDDGEEADEAESSDEQQPSPEDIKRHNDEMAKARIAEREARREAEALRKQQEEANIEQYLREAADDADELRQRQHDVEQYRLKQERIDLNTEKLQTNLQRAVADIDLFKTGTEAVRNRLLRAVDQFEATNIAKDEQGRPVEIRGDIYQYLQDEANSIRELLGDGARQQVKEKSKQKARTMTKPGNAPKKAKVDPDLEAFDAEAASW